MVLGVPVVRDLLDHMRRGSGRHNYRFRYCSRATEKQDEQGRDFAYTRSHRPQFHQEVGASDILLRRFLTPTMEPLPPAAGGRASQVKESAEAGTEIAPVNQGGSQSGVRAVDVKLAHCAPEPPDFLARRQGDESITGKRSAQRHPPNSH